jgi:site-specific recombinase XerD
VRLRDATRADLEDFLADLLARRSAATAATRYKVLRVLYRWLEEEEDVPNPMAKMRPPLIPEQPVPVISPDGLRRLLKACEGKGFEARRDTALIMLLLDTGARRDELMSRTLGDLDQDLDVLLVLGKGRRERALPYGHKTALALDRYLRVRERHKDAPPALAMARVTGPAHRLGPGPHARTPWPGGRAAGLHPHQFRHTFAHQWLAEVDLMRLAGVAVAGDGGPYGASAADARARDAHRRLSPGTTRRFLRRHTSRPMPKEPGGGVYADINQSRSSVRRSGMSSSDAILR